MICDTCVKRKATHKLRVAKGTKNEKEFKLCEECYNFHKDLIRHYHYDSLEWY